jgi:hypothetical protein
MLSSSHWSLRIIFLLGLINTHAAVAQLDRSVSASRQFVIYGTTGPLRGAVGDLAEKTKKNLLDLLQQPDDWKTPIILNLQFPKANLPDIPPAACYFSQTGSGLRLQLDLVIGANVDADAIQRELLRAILLEMAYRKEQNLPAGTVYVSPPEWLVEGLLAAAPGRDRETLVSVLDAVVASKSVVDLEKFLRPHPLSGLDSPARRLYRAYSFALVRLLLDEPDGPSRFTAYIQSLPAASNDPLSDLEARFPVLGRADDVNATWKSKVAAVSAAHDFELLTFSETENRLKDLLAGGITTGSGSRLGLEKVCREKLSVKQRGEILFLSRRLLQLSTIANPLMRPVVLEYQEITRLLAANRKRGIAARLAGVNSTRARLVARMNDVDDYMNWCEATKSDTPSGRFLEYFKAADESADKVRRRRDPISVYLDALEEEF